MVVGSVLVVLVVVDDAVAATAVVVDVPVVALVVLVAGMAAAVVVGGSVVAGGVFAVGFAVCSVVDVLVGAGGVVVASTHPRVGNRNHWNIVGLLEFIENEPIRKRGNDEKHKVQGGKAISEDMNLPLIVD